MIFQKSGLIQSRALEYSQLVLILTREPLLFHSFICSVHAHPELQNIAQVLAYNQQAQAALALDKHGMADLQNTIADLSATLHSMLCL
jgi:hypothetical protein